MDGIHQGGSDFDAYAHAYPRSRKQSGVDPDAQRVEFLTQSAARRESRRKWRVHFEHQIHTPRVVIGGDGRVGSTDAVHSDHHVLPHRKTQNAQRRRQRESKLDHIRAERCFLHQRQRDGFAVERDVRTRRVHFRRPRTDGIARVLLHRFKFRFWCRTRRTHKINAEIRKGCFFLVNVPASRANVRRFAHGFRHTLGVLR